jgi:hypothetical protein
MTRRKPKDVKTKEYLGKKVLWITTKNHESILIHS